ncbi:MAG: hypothetical protein RSF40_10665 [Oscillospiraceae bacterium]
MATNKTTSFNVSVDDGVQTRAIAVNDLTRFVMEVYEGATATGTPVKHTEQPTGLFNDVLLKDKQMYTVVFWADYGVPSADGTNNTANEYDASNLKAARVVASKQPTKAAYSGVSRFTVGTDVEAVYTKVTLTHSVAQVNFIQTEALTTATNMLVVSYPQSFSVNVGDSTVTPIPGVITHNFNYNYTVADTLGTSYLIAAKGASKTLLEITATLNNETPKVVSNVPFERNYRTNISGPYSSKYNETLTVICEGVWGTPENNVTFPKVKVGDFYYSDKTYSTTYDKSRTCIGIVFVVNADGMTGKIVGLTQSPIGKVWGDENTDESLTVLGIRSDTDGATATKNMIIAHKDKTNFATKYSAFEWVYTTVNSGDINGRWYIPAIEELKALYGKFSNIGEPINADVKTAVNLSLNIVSATQLDTYIWSSTEEKKDFAHNVHLGYGVVSQGVKNNPNYSVRVVSAF